MADVTLVEHDQYGRLHLDQVLEVVTGRERRSLLSLMLPLAGKTRVVAHPDEVVGPQIEHPLEITFAVALVALRQRVRLAGDATLLSSAEIPTKATGRGR